MHRSITFNDSRDEPKGWATPTNIVREENLWWGEEGDLVARTALKFIYIQLDKNYKLFRIPSRIPIGICLTAFFSFNLTGAGKNNCFQLRRSNPRLRNFSTQKPHSQIFIKKISIDPENIRSPAPNTPNTNKDKGLSRSAWKIALCSYALSAPLFRLFAPIINNYLQAWKTKNQ